MTHYTLDTQSLVRRLRADLATLQLMQRMGNSQVWQAIDRLEALQPVLEAVVEDKPIEVCLPDGTWGEVTNPLFDAEPERYRVKRKARTICFRAYVWRSMLVNPETVTVVSYVKGTQNRPDEDGSTLTGFVRWLDTGWRETTLED